MVSRLGGRRSSNALLISLALHMIAAVFFLNYEVRLHFRQAGTAVSVEWVKDVPEPELKRELPKQPIQMKFDPTRDLNLKAEKKLSRPSPSNKAWVKEKSYRLVERSVEDNDAERRDTIPDIMTAAQVRDSHSTISGLISTDVGPMDGDGEVGNRVRAKGSGGGDRSGVSVLGLGGGGDGLAGGGGGGGILDRLGIINFIRESDGPQKVIYCLDVSASMAVGAKLAVSTRSLKESMLQLSDFDEFNIVTFHTGVRNFREKTVPATLRNIEKANRFLDSLTPRSIENNLGTDILAALRYALNVEPSVIVLITDIQPTRGEVDETRIAEEVRQINKNTKIYGIGVEVWEPSPTGRLAKLLKMLTEQNNGEMRLATAG